VVLEVAAAAVVAAAAARVVVRAAFSTRERTLFIHPL
jgi:hypothetical protein